MFKPPQTVLLFAVLVSTARDSHQNSLEGARSDADAFQEMLVKQRSNWLPWPTEKCSHGFTYLPSTRSCYRVVYESHDWYSAAKKCRQLRSDAHLAAITSAEENREVKTYLANEVARNLGITTCYLAGSANYGIVFWTSGQQLIKGNCRSPFVWRLANDKLLSFDFTNWNGGEPNCGSGEMCMGIWVYNNFRWDDHPCGYKTCPLCEYTP